MHNTVRRTKITVSADGTGLVSQAGMLLLAEAARVTGLGQGLSGALARWRAPRAVHDPGKILTDLAMALALGGDCLADVAVLRAQPELAGPVASDPVISRLVATLAAEGPRALKAIRKARAAARERAWALAGERAPGADGSLIPVDLDATIVLAHSEKEKAAPTWKKTYGFHPLAAFADHGAGAGGEPLAILLRAGNAGSNTAAEHIEVTKLALAQLPRQAAAPGADPHRLRRRHPRLRDLAGQPVPPPALLGRHDHHRGHARRDPHPPRAGLGSPPTTPAARCGRARGSPS